MGLSSLFIKAIIKIKHRQIVITVTLTSALGKLFEKLLLNRIQKLLEKNNTVVPHNLQFGFIKEHGSIPAIFTIKNQ